MSTQSTKTIDRLKSPVISSV